jgi:hypothetical protein
MQAQEKVGQALNDFEQQIKAQEAANAAMNKPRWSNNLRYYM